MAKLSQFEVPDGTEITACIGTQKFVFEVRGVLVSIAEMGELISWLGAALRTSPRDNGLIYCVPNMRRIASNTAPSNQNGGLRPCTHDIYEINFAMEEISQRLPEVNGQCWHDIFKNPVVVRGYPIPRRREWRTGLEISLNIMAGLAQTQRLNQFKEKTYIKGFSTMLFPTKENGEIVCWHLIYDKKGGRISYNNDRDGISYLGDDKDQEGCVGQINLENYRHVLGWCSEARLYAGELDFSIFPAVDEHFSQKLQRFCRSTSPCNSLEASQASCRLFSRWSECFRRKDASEWPSI